MKKLHGTTLVRRTTAASWISRAYPLLTMNRFGRPPGIPNRPEPFSIPLRGDVENGSIAGFHLYRLSVNTSSIFFNLVIELGYAIVILHLIDLHRL